jgi:hypothetical protein
MELRIYLRALAERQEPLLPYIGGHDSLAL